MHTMDCTHVYVHTYTCTLGDFVVLWKKIFVYARVYTLLCVCVCIYTCTYGLWATFWLSGGRTTYMHECILSRVCVCIYLHVHMHNERHFSSLEGALSICSLCRVCMCVHIYMCTYAYTKYSRIYSTVYTYILYSISILSL